MYVDYDPDLLDIGKLLLKEVGSLDVKTTSSLQEGLSIIRVLHLKRLSLITRCQ
jgi:hypothetical protein